MPAPHAPTVNPEHHLNNPEQIRTNLNKPEHRQTPRPDREPPKITPKTPRKNKTPEHPLFRHSGAVRRAVCSMRIWRWLGSTPLWKLGW